MSWIRKNFRREEGGINFGQTYSLVRLTDETYFGEAEGALGSLFGFCGCGTPEAPLRLLRDAMRLIDVKPNNPHDFDKWKAAYRIRRAAMDELFHHDKGVEYLVWYLLDDKKLTEHGTSVPGWLTDLGRDVLVDLDELLSLIPEGAA